VESLPLKLYYRGKDVTNDNTVNGTDYYDSKNNKILLCAGNTNFNLVKKLSGISFI
jgi:hypothetical protein